MIVAAPNETQPVDFYDVESYYSEEEIQIRDTVRQFVDNEVIPIIADHFENGTFPKHLIPKLAEMGCFGATLPTEYGCAGVSNLAYGLMMQELERGDSGIRSFVSVQGTLAMYPIYAFGSEEQKRKWLPELAAARKIGCFGLTEPDHGSDPAGMKTTATEVSDGYVLNGSKMWITSGTVADVAVVWAKLNGEIAGFLVEKGTPGLRAVEQKHKLSLRASITAELYFSDCKIPKENRLPHAKGLKAPLSTLNQARYGISFGAIGAAMGCYESVVNYTKTRVQFGKPIASFQMIQAKLAIMLTEITKAQLVCLQLARLKDSGKLKPAHVSLAKRNNCHWALEIARMAREMMGANGITLEYPVMRHMCNLETVKTYEGTHDIHTLTLGREITGISAFV
jgi:glutaryl-CoA dehydrogenase